MANTYTWKIPRTMNVNLSRIVPLFNPKRCLSCIIHGRSWPSDPKNPAWLLLEVHSSIGVVKIRRLYSDHVDLLYVVSPEFFRKFLPMHTDNGTGSYEIIRIAWNGTCTARVCESTPLLAIILGPTGQVTSNMIMLVISLDPLFGLRVIARYDVAKPKQEYIISDVAITEAGDPMIIWLCRRKFQYKFIVYKGMTDFLDNSQYLTEETINNIQGAITFPDRISYIRIHGEKVLLLSSSIQTPLWKGIQTMGQGMNFAVEDNNLPELHAIWHSDLVGIPMTDFHHHKITYRDLNSGAPTCVNTALKLIVNRKGYDASHTVPLRKGVFILKSVQYPLECKKFDPYESNGALEHITVACLADPPDLHNLPTIGLKIALSPRNKRIALAAWRTLRIYAIEPLAFLSPKCSYGSKKSHTRDSPHDYAFVNQCGWSYHSNGSLENGCVVLEPVDLASPGVIYEMEWRHEHELWALTNEGVCKWDIGVHADGQKMVLELVED